MAFKENQALMMASWVDLPETSGDPKQVFGGELGGDFWSFIPKDDYAGRSALVLQT